MIIVNRQVGLLLFFILFPCVTIFGQKEIKGRVLDEQTRNPIAKVTVTIHPAHEKSIITYVSTLSDGSFTLKSSAMPDSVTISVRSMTIESQSKTVSSDIGFVEFIVEEKITELKEVIIKAPKIRQLGDTIHYDVASFLDETDRSIGDVLKKLPGVQVLSSGRILYQDKPISKFYVEGLDLLKGKYGIATNNIDASNVASVQVFENHQPIKVLKDMEMPETAAINLKLKKSALGAFFITAQAGVGLSENILLSNELTGMRFASSQQDMMVYKGDNTGRDITQELTSFYGGSGESYVSFMGVVAPTPPPINNQHHLFNDAHLGSLNSLKLLKEDISLTGNISYLYDQQKSSSFTQRDIFIADGENIQIVEDMSAHLMKRELEGALTLEGNTNNYYLKNKLSVSAKWNEHFGYIDATQPISQMLQQPSINVSNDFEYSKRTGNKNFRIGSYVSYISQNHSLGVSPILFEDVFSDLSVTDTLIRQDVSYKHLRTNHFLSGGSLGKRLSFNYSTNVFSDHYFMQSDLFISDASSPVLADSLQNQLYRNEIGVQFNTGFSYNFTEKFKPMLSFPISYVYINRNDRIRNNKKVGGRVRFSPLLIIQYPISSRIALFSNVAYSNSFSGISDDYLGYMMSNYRSLNRSDGMLGKSSQASAFVHFSYKNPFTTLFSSLRLSYSNRWSSTLADMRYNGILSSTTKIPYSNTSHFYDVNYSISQSISYIDSEVSLSAGYNNSQSVLLNQGEISNIVHDSYSISPSITTDIGKLMIIKYNLMYRYDNNKIRNEFMPSVHNLSQNLIVSLIPIKKLILSLSLNHYYNNIIESSDRSIWFGNAGVKYRAKNIDWMLDWTNVFNTRQFTNYSNSDISSYYSVYNLRPSEILLRVRFKIM